MCPFEGIGNFDYDKKKPRNNVKIIVISLDILTFNFIFYLNIFHIVLKNLALNFIS